MCGLKPKTYTTRLIKFALLGAYTLQLVMSNHIVSTP